GDEVVRGADVIDKWRGRLLGVAVDVGTTTVATELIDLETGGSLCRGGFENPQRFGGSDVISRVSYDATHQGELHGTIVKALNNEIQGLCQQAGVSRHTLYEVLLVGNSTMRDLVFGLDIQTIGQRPYKSVTEHEFNAGSRSGTGLETSARRLGLLASAYARVVSPPLVASHVGADVAAGLIACDFDLRTGTRVFLDIGTNTEVVIATPDRMVAASCPAGPAFEGGLVEFGLPACDGAIDSVKAVGNGFQYTTLSDLEPVGICGSGLVDLLAELKRTSQMTPLGVFTAEGRRAREVSVVDVPRITLSRMDASHLAQAKAASFCGQFILLRMLEMDPARVDNVFLAGGFADSIDIEAAISIGFLAPFPIDRVRRIGNAALEGARQLILDTEREERVARLVEEIEHVELETAEDFFEVFTEACQFKPMRM
ncbi:ASKHA domain-containing protein, partial [Planctomycetaceae bacterium]|nr:ASKHA domain-containing protein [Planctomycetaceae bacterium]